MPAYTDLLKLNMASVVWVDKNDGDTKLKLFSVPKSALVEAEWLRSQGHRDVQVVQGGLRLT